VERNTALMSTMDCRVATGSHCLPLTLVTLNFTHTELSFLEVLVVYMVV
jgi:hypothetical protein